MCISGAGDVSGVMDDGCKYTSSRVLYLGSQHYIPTGLQLHLMQILS